MILPKISIKKILFASDLSESARHALAYAVSLSNTYGAGITIVHAIDETPGMDAAIRYHVGSEQWEEIKKRNEGDARNRIIAKQHEDHPAMKEALGHLYRNVSENLENQSFVLDEVVVKRGYPVDLIIDTAEKLHCDLIVMGTQGHGGLARMLIGSTAQKVMQRSRIPVLVVRLPESP